MKNICWTALGKPRLSMLRIAQKEARKRGVGDVPAVLSALDQKRLETAINFLKTIEIEVDKYPIIVLDGLSDGILGMAEGGKIYLSSRVFMMGTKMVAGTLLEEYIHLEKGLCDNTRQMQNYLKEHTMTHAQEPNKTADELKQEIEMIKVHEDQQTITDWTDETFGVKHPATVAARMNIEVAELLEALVLASTQAGSPKRKVLAAAVAANRALAEVLVQGLTDPTWDVGDWTDAERNAIQEECADVLIMLSQVAQKSGGVLQTLVDHKMEVNRARKWVNVGGRFQHE